MSDEARAYTKEEVREEFLAHLRHLAVYWANVEGQTVQELVEGALFSALNVFDGTSMSLPMFDLVLRPHPDDQAYHVQHGENWYEDGMVINDDVYLHDEFYKKEI